MSKALSELLELSELSELLELWNYGIWDTWSWDILNFLNFWNFGILFFFRTCLGLFSLEHSLVRTLELSELVSE